MKWYNYIVILGVILLAMWIWIVFDFIIYMDRYEAYYNKTYRISSFDFKYLIGMFLCSLVFILIGGVLEKLYKR